MSLISIFCSLSFLILGSRALTEVEIPAGKRLYTDYQVLRAYTDTGEKRSQLLRLGHSVDFWTEVGPRSQQVDMMVEPEQVSRVTNFLAYKGITFQVMTRDLQADIDMENAPQPTGETQDTALSETRRDKRQNSPGDKRQNSPGDKRQNSPGDGQFSLPTFSLWRSLAGRQRTRRKPQDVFQSTLPVPAEDATSSSFPTSSSAPKSPPARAPAVSPCGRTGMSWSQYQSHHTIYNWLNCLAAYFPDKTKLMTIGKSSEGRPLQVMRIGSGDSSKPAVFIDGGLHAREWASPAAVTFLIQRMVESDEFSRELDTYNVYILPLANPDGYEYSRDHDRMWRKTRSRTGKKNLFGQECRGVDPNRNFGYQWGGYGASRDACKETFMGKFPFSEPETKAMRNFLTKEAADFKMYLTFHSYGQYILYPWGYDTLDTRDQAELHRVGQAAVKELGQNLHAKYQLGSAAKMLYPASGGSDDWAKGGAGIKYSYTIELPDTGRHGFILPASNIKSVGVQTSAVVKSMLGAVSDTLPK